MPESKPKAKKAYRAIVGLNYPVKGSEDEKRVEPGDVVDDIPASVVEVWLEQGVIALVGGEEE